MQRSNNPSGRSTWCLGSVALVTSLSSGFALLGCAETTTLSNEHRPSTDAPSPDRAELERRAFSRARDAVAAERTFDIPPPDAHPARYPKPGPTGTPAQRANEAPPGFYQERAYPFAAGCECNVSTATLNVAIPCGMSACVNDRKFDCDDEDSPIDRGACEPASTCKCTLDSDGAGPKGFAIDCGTNVCFEGAVTTCTPEGRIERGSACGK